MYQTTSQIFIFQRECKYLVLIEIYPKRFSLHDFVMLFVQTVKLSSISQLTELRSKHLLTFATKKRNITTSEKSYCLKVWKILKCTKINPMLNRNRKIYSHWMNTCRRILCETIVAVRGSWVAKGYCHHDSLVKYSSDFNIIHRVSWNYIMNKNLTLKPDSKFDRNWFIWFKIIFICLMTSLTLGSHCLNQFEKLIGVLSTTCPDTWLNLYTWKNSVKMTLM